MGSVWRDTIVPVTHPTSGEAGSGSLGRRSVRSAAERGLGGEGGGLVHRTRSGMLIAFGCQIFQGGSGKKGVTEAGPFSSHGPDASVGVIGPSRDNEGLSDGAPINFLDRAANRQSKEAGEHHRWVGIGKLDWIIVLDGEFS